MADLIRDKVDPKMVLDGVWVNIPSFGKVKIRRMNNAAYNAMVIALRDAKVEELNLKPEEDLDEEHSFPIMVEAMCRTVILDWDDITSDGKPVAYTPELGIEIFGDEDGAWREEFQLITARSRERSRYVKERKEANTKK